MKSIVFLARDAHTKVEGTSMKHLLDSMRQIPTKTHRGWASNQPEERLLGPGVSHKLPSMKRRKEVLRKHVGTPPPQSYMQPLERELLY